MRTPTPEELQAEVDAGRVRRRQHPTLPLSLYTYSEHTVYSEGWNEVNRVCRGLVVEDTTGRVVAWPFPKFFNYHDHVNGKPYAPPLPDLPFEVAEKIDGSLGIIFHYADRWHVATKGSFVSDQARWAQAWLEARDHDLYLTPGFTYLVEIMYAENRIVTEVKDDTLVLLGAFTPGGTEVHPTIFRNGWTALGGRLVATFTASSVEHIAACAADNRHFVVDLRLSGTETEGWVIRYQDGTRVKIKIEDYVRLHGVLTRTNARTVWDVLSTGGDISSLLEVVPDEFAAWVRTTVDDLCHRQVVWSTCAQAEFSRLSHLRHDRKAFALEAQSSPYRAALFRLLDGRDITELAWKAVRPEADIPAYTSDPGAVD